MTRIMQDDIKKKTKKELRRLLDEQRMALLYLKFDIEATCRERDYWKKKANG